MQTPRSRDAVAEAIDRFRSETLRRLADIRLAGAAAFLVTVSWLGLAHRLDDWRVYVAPLAVYIVLAIGLRVASRQSLNAWAVPLLDVPAVFVLQYLSMPMSPFPAGVAGWSLGLFEFFAVLSALALETPVIVATLVVTCVAEGTLQRVAGVGWGAVVASALVLSLAAAATAWITHRLVALIAQLVTSEVGRRVAEEQNEELARANATVARINEELQESQRNAETLTNLLVHDMKGPLTGVIGAFDLVEMRTEDLEPIPEMAEELAMGRRSANRLLGMIGDLLGIARLEQGEFRPSRSPTDVEAIIADVAADHRRAADRNGVTLAASVPAALRANIDEELVRRALDNLVSNALSFTPRGERVQIEAAHDNGALSLIVRNDGPTIHPEDRARLFGKHSMLGARRGHHAGLGLYLCRLVASAHGGEISLVDEPGWPVSFVMRLPDA